MPVCVHLDHGTDHDDAKKLAEETGIDALSCAFGTVHGLYLKEPKLDFPRLAKINDLLNIPLVMHGGSGVSDEDFKKVISIGIRKINYYAYMAKAGVEAVLGAVDSKYFHDVEFAAQAGIKEDVKRAIKVFC